VDAALDILLDAGGIIRRPQGKANGRAIKISRFWPQRCPQIGPGKAEAVVNSPIPRWRIVRNGKSPLPLPPPMGEGTCF